MIMCNCVDYNYFSLSISDSSSWILSQMTEIAVDSSGILTFQDRELS